MLMLDSLLTTVLDTLDTLDLLFTVGFVKKKKLIQIFAYDRPS